MAKNDHAHAIRLAESLRSHAGDDAAKEFAAQYPLSKSADVAKKSEWARSVCSFLDARYDDETIRAIRKECRCNDGVSIANKIMMYLKKADSIEAFVADFNAHETFASFVYLTDHQLLFCYPECYCACVKRAPGELSRAWCYCTLGNAEAIFKRVFHDGVQVTLLESIKTGGERCVIEVTW